MKIKDVLIINSYAGSLTLAATRLGLKIRGSYEDCAYGLKTQALNFPMLDYRPIRKEWPEQDLRKTLVIAHPPCAAFSQLNCNMKHTQGVDSANFAPTLDVMRYAMSQKCQALLIESVPRAAAGAGAIYESMAAKWGYSLFKVFQNSASFGVPQWRQRFWVIFIRDKGRKLPLHLAPRCQLVAHAVEHLLEYPQNPTIFKDFKKQREGLTKGGMGKIETARFLEDSYGRLSDAMARYQGVASRDKEKLIKQYHMRPFHNHQLTMLKEDDFATVLTGVSTYVYKGMSLPAAAYNVIMGFPAGYKFHHPGYQRTYLSKGVCPPVAAWLIGEVLRDSPPPEAAPGDFVALLKDGESAVFWPKRDEAKQARLFS